MNAFMAYILYNSIWFFRRTVSLVFRSFIWTFRVKWMILLLLNRLPANAHIHILKRRLMQSKWFMCFKIFNCTLGTILWLRAKFLVFDQLETCDWNRHMWISNVRQKLSFYWENSLDRLDELVLAKTKVNIVTQSTFMFNKHGLSIVENERWRVFGCYISSLSKSGISHTWRGHFH